jgi:hypothetical protein
MRIKSKAFLLRTGFVGFLLVAANILVAIHHLGTRSGQTYRWVCKQSGAELSVNQGAFGQVKLRAAQPMANARHQWQLQEPRPLRPWQPWNWLALVLQRPTPDPDDLLRQDAAARR